MTEEPEPGGRLAGRGRSGSPKRRRRVLVAAVVLAQLIGFV